MALDRPKVLLVGWDAADWNMIRPLLEAGEMPNLARLMAGGVSGNLATIYPPLSPMLWTSIATGKRPGKHGIHGFIEPIPGGAGVRPISSLSRSAKAVWNILNQNGKRSVVVGWWPSHPAEPIHGVMVSDLYPKAGEGPRPLNLIPDTVYPPEWAQRLAALRVTPRELPGEVIRLFVPQYDRIDQQNDKRLHSLAKIIAETMSVHAAATEALEHTDWDFAALYYDAIDHFCHAFMRYHPPRLDWVEEESFEIFQHVVATAYRYHDAMLGRLLQLAGPETNVLVLSDHGFHSDARRTSYIPPEMAGPAVEHRHFGMVCLCGPGIRRGQPLYGGGVLDITPTLLHLFGLPVGQDMDGKVLVTALETNTRVQTIASWEQVEGDAGRHPPGVRLNPIAAAEALKQLIALGYIAPPPDDVRTHVEECVAELKYNLARAYDDENRYDLSVPLYEELLAIDPDEHRVIEALFHNLLRLRRHTEARKLLQTFDERSGLRAAEATLELERWITAKQEKELDTGRAPMDKREAHQHTLLCAKAGGHVLQRALLHFQLDMQQGHMAEAQQSFVALETVCAQTGARMPALLAAELFARRGKTVEALIWVERALESDPENWQALALAAQLHLEAKRYKQSLAMAAASLGLVYYQPLMHYVMGHALMGMRDYKAVEQPLRIAIAQLPGFVRAHDLLCRLYADHLNCPGDAALHFVRAEQLRQSRKAKQHAPEEPSLLVSIEPVSRPVFPRRSGTCSAEATREVIVVSGLPRSGTSMLMQMLAAGGVTPLTDGLRGVDEDNPRGYFEYERATRLYQDATWIAEAQGKVVKLVLPLVPFLPPTETYRLVVIQRDLSATLASQERMLSRMGRVGEGANLSSEALKREYCAQEHRVANWLESHVDIAVLPLEYDAILSDPHKTAEEIASFLGRGFDAVAAAQAVEPALKRQAGRN